MVPVMAVEILSVKQKTQNKTKTQEGRVLKAQLALEAFLTSKRRCLYLAAA